MRSVAVFEESRSGANIVFGGGGGRAFNGTEGGGMGAGCSGCDGADRLSGVGDVVELTLGALSFDSSLFASLVMVCSLFIA